MLSKSKGASKNNWTDTSFNSAIDPPRSRSPYLDNNNTSFASQQPSTLNNPYTRSHGAVNYAPPMFQNPAASSQINQPTSQPVPMPAPQPPALQTPPAQGIPPQHVPAVPQESKFPINQGTRPSTVYSTQPPQSTVTVNSKTHKKSHSLGLPTLKKSKVKVAIYFDQPMYTAGALLTGRLELTCISNEVIKLGDIHLEVTGYEELRIEQAPNTNEKVRVSRNSRVFYKTSLIIQDGQHFCEAVDQATPPDLEGYWLALKGKTSFPFALKLADTLPNSVTTGVGKIEYKVEGLIAAKIGIYKHNVTFSKPVNIYEIWNPEEITKYREMGVQDEVKKKLFLGGSNYVEMWAELVRGLVFAGGLAYIRVLIKNQSSKKAQGIRCSLWKKVTAQSDLLVGPNKLGADSAPKLISEAIFDDEDYKFEPKQDRLVMVAMNIPIGCLSLRNTSIIQISYFIKVTVSSNLNQNFEVNLPLYISHPASWIDPIPFLIPNSAPPTPPVEVAPEAITNTRVLKTTFAEPVRPHTPDSFDSYESLRETQRQPVISVVPAERLSTPISLPASAPVRATSPVSFPASTPVRAPSPASAPLRAPSPASAPLRAPSPARAPSPTCVPSPSPAHVPTSVKQESIPFPTPAPTPLPVTTQGRKPPPSFTPAASLMGQSIERVKSEPVPNSHPVSDNTSLMDMLEGDKSFQWLKDYSISEKAETMSQVNEKPITITEPIPEAKPNTKPAEANQMEKIVINGKVYYVVPEPPTPELTNSSPLSDGTQEQKDSLSPVNSSHHQKYMQVSSAPNTLSKDPNDAPSSTSTNNRHSNNPFISNEPTRQTSVSRSKAIRRDSRTRARGSASTFGPGSIHLDSSPVIEEPPVDSASSQTARAPLTTSTFEPPANSLQVAPTTQANYDTTLKRSETIATVTSSTGSMTSAGFMQSIHAMASDDDKPPQEEKQYNWDAENTPVLPQTAVHTSEEELKKLTHPAFPVKRVNSRAVRSRRSIQVKPAPSPIKQDTVPPTPSPLSQNASANSSHETVANPEEFNNSANLEKQLHQLQAQMASLMASLQNPASPRSTMSVPQTYSGASPRSKLKQKLKAKRTASLASDYSQ